MRNTHDNQLLLLTTTELKLTTNDNYYYWITIDIELNKGQAASRLGGRWGTWKLALHLWRQSSNPRGFFP
jgi:hypothetical protein